MAFDLGFIIVVHPPVDSKLRAWCGTKRGKDDGKYRPANQHTEPRPYIERNHDIVDACDVLVAIPGTEEQGLRSGTWATMRYAHKQGKRIEAVLPSGKRWTPDPLTERLS